MPRAAIIGCGTAGPAAALNLVRRIPGWKVDIYDRACEPRAVGAGIGIQPIGLTALKRLGLLERVLAHGARVDGIKTWVKPNDWPVLDVSYSRYHPQLYGLGLHRGVLFELLLEECIKSADVDLRFGADVATLDQVADGQVTVRASDTGTPLGQYDLVMLADGTRSKLRAQLGIPSYFRQYAYGALFVLLPDPTHTFGNHLQQVYSGEGCSVTLGFLPTGTPWESGLDTVGDGAVDTHADFTSTMFYNLRHDEFDKWERGGLAKWKDECCELMPDAADLIQQGITHRNQVAFATYADGIMWRFNAGKVVCIGDCSHSMSPQLGQGANLALIDAAKLVDCLEQTPDVNAALNQYTSDRWSRVTFYQAHSRLLTPIFASRSRSLRVLRDHLMYYMCHTPLLETYIHGILCGAQSPRVFTTIPKEEYLGFLDDPRV